MPDSPIQTPYAHHDFAFFRIIPEDRTLTLGGAVSSAKEAGSSLDSSGPPFLFFLTKPIVNVFTPAAAACVRTSTIFVPVTAWPHASLMLPRAPERTSLIQRLELE